MRLHTNSYLDTPALCTCSLELTIPGRLPSGWRCCPYRKMYCRHSCTPSRVSYPLRVPLFPRKVTPPLRHADKISRTSFIIPTLH
jgi:hypothetical protein